jgi:AraC-like DNA-binding protein
MSIRKENAGKLLNSTNAIQLLPFGREKANTHTDVRCFTDYVGGAIDTILDYESASKESEFFYVSSGIEINGLKILASVSSPSNYKVNANKGFYFMIPMYGSASVISDGINEISETGTSAYFSPEIERKGSTSDLSMVQMSIEEDRLNFTASRMLDDVEYRRFKSSLDRPRLLGLENSGEQCRSIIYNLCKMIDVSGLDEKTLKLLSVDELFYRTLVLMIRGKFESDSLKNISGDHSKAVAHRAAEYISANYNQRINQTDLEEITGVSYRNISTSFRKHFGYSPLEWLNRQRLDLLQYRLLSSNEMETVESLSNACGFISTRSLRNIYVQNFGETPHETLKRRKNKTHKS